MCGRACDDAALEFEANARQQDGDASRATYVTGGEIAEGERAHGENAEAGRELEQAGRSDDVGDLPTVLTEVNSGTSLSTNTNARNRTGADAGNNAECEAKRGADTNCSDENTSD